MRLDRRCVKVMQIIVLCRIDNSINKFVNVFRKIDFRFFMRDPPPNQPKGAVAITLISL